MALTAGKLLQPDGVVVGGEQPVKSVDGYGETIFSRTVDNELIDLANKVDIAIPSWAKKVEMVIEGKSGQSGADNSILMIFNNDTGTNYARHDLKAVTTSASAAQATGGTYDVVFFVTNSSNDSGITLINLFPKAQGTNYKHVDVVRKYADPNNTIITRKLSWQNTVDDITSIQIYALLSTNVSCVITARAWS